jgi:hypothetical protein
MNAKMFADSLQTVDKLFANVPTMFVVVYEPCVLGVYSSVSPALPSPGDRNFT